jgi:exopolysaccharide biosynthesis protein
LIIIKDRVWEISDQGNSPIPRNGYVLSAQGTFADDLRSTRLKDRVLYGTQLRATNAGEKEIKVGNTKLPSYDIVQGVPLLISNGEVDIPWEREKTTKSFVETRHPRTAVAKLRDGKFLMITVDGRSESSGGLSLYDLADYLLSIGAVDAMNLDGGGSTTMFLDGKVVNTPSDKEGERKVGDAIVVTLRKKNK